MSRNDRVELVKGVELIQAGHMDDDATETPPPARPDRTLLAVLVTVGLLVVIALVVVLVRGGARESLDPSTPEGVVQLYAQAVIDGDDTKAATYLAGQSEDCDYYYGSDTDNVRLTLKSTEISGSHATVRVSVTTSYGGGGGLFGGGEYSTDDEFSLVRSGDAWLVADTPYEFTSCGATVVD